MIRRYRVLVSVAFSLLGAAALAGSFACMNIYSPIDKPSGYDQTLSAARAAFDRGDYAKAREYYGDLGGDQTAIAETVFLNLDGCGADIDAFATALSDGTSNSGSPGVMITDLAEKMNASGLISSACFATLLSSYQTAQTLTDPNLQGFASFLTALGIMGAVMGTNDLINTTGGSLLKSDFITNTSTCTNFPGSCGGGTQCSKADGISGAAAVALSSAGSIGPTWGTFQGAVAAANSALTTLGISTGASATLVNFLVTNGAAITASDNSYRCMLTSFGVGR